MKTFESVVDAMNILNAIRQGLERDSEGYRRVSNAMAHLYHSTYNSPKVYNPVTAFWR